ncbi:MAG TPA: transporter substrate-binding domain-containing protein [Desulfomonilia bacterium]|nr:transporter substrate-binding domain-containing protein [Desulfomonilia bacterium]
MNKLIVIGLLLSACTFLPVHVSADQITIVADSWCPFTCEPGSESPGYMIEIAEHVFKKAGHTVVYKNVDWKKAIEETRKGKYTAIAGGYKSDSPDFVFPDKAQGVSQNVFFVKKGTAWKYTGIESLKKIKLGIVLDYSYSDQINKYISENKGKSSVYVAKGTTPIQENIDKLMKGEINAFIEDPSVYGNYCGSRNLIEVLGAVQTAGSDGLEEKNYIAFSPANPKSKEYASILSKGLDQMRASGELKKILSKYYMKDWE